MLNTERPTQDYENRTNKSMPDYKLFMMSGVPFCQSITHLFFDIYIDKRKLIGIGKESIEARIEGFYGTGTIEGEISAENVEFTVTYDADAIKEGAPKGKTIYSGHKFKEAYIGNYKRIVGGKDEDFSENNRFGLRKFDLKKHEISMDAPSRKKNHPTNLLSN